MARSRRELASNPVPVQAGRSDAGVVVVLYNPDDEDLLNLARLVEWGVGRVVAVVNAIDDARRARLPAAGLRIIENGRNLGLARALNQGISAALEDGVRYVLLLDQDSRPTPAMLDELLAAASAIEVEGRALACVAPVLHDRKAGTASYGTREPLSFATSGTLLTRAAWERVGPKWEPLFIDGIDHEWCFRARARGMETVLVRSASMEHDLGDEGYELFGRFFAIHRSPVRHYHIVRNTLWLARKRYIPIAWRVSELVKLGYRIGAYLITSDDRRRTFGQIASAFVDGFRATGGRPG